MTHPMRMGRWRNCVGTTAFLLFIGALWPLSGQEAPGTAVQPSLTLQDCVSLAMEENPLVLSAGRRHQASLARVRQARALPQPSLDIDSDLQPELTDFSGYGERYVGISQTIPFPGRRYLQSRIAREESNQVLMDLELVRMDVAYQVKEAFYGFLLAREQLDYANRNLELTRNFLDMTELKFAAGDVARVDVIRARVEMATATNAVRTAENEVRLARGALNFLMGRRASAPLEVEGKLRMPLGSPELEEMTEYALTSRPEVRQVNFAIEQETLTKRQGYLGYLPDFDVGASRHQIPGETNTWDVTLSVALPLYFWQPARGEIAEAEANLRAREDEARHLANAVALEVEEAFVSLTAAAAQIRLFEEEILPQAEEAYEMYQFSYEQGEIGGMELIQARRTLNDARTSYADALFNYDVARAAMDRAVGRTMEE